MPQQIDVVIDTNGDIVVSTKGFTGKSCQEATAQLERALGATTSDRPTAEMHKPVANVLRGRS